MSQPLRTIEQSPDPTGAMLPDEMEHLFEAIANYTYDWESWMGPDGRLRWVNPAVERMTGYAVAECLTMPDYPLPLIHEDDRPVIAAHLATAAQGASGNDVAFRIREKSGTVRWVSVSWQTLFDAGGTVRGYRTSIRDISARKAAEDALRAAHAEAERANQAKSRFLAAASHDLRQPLQALNMFVAALGATSVDARSREIIGAIEDSLHATNDLLDSLLDVSRLDAGILQVNRRRLAIIDLLDRMEAEFAEPAREKGLELRVVPSSAVVETDPTLLDRIIRNLTANAVRYTDRGRVLIGCRRRGGMLRVEVRDTGIGIPAEKLRAVFEEFYQIGNPERDRTRGLGLGLAIVDRIAKLLGHRVDVWSRPGHGSLFSIAVPLAEPSATREGRASVRQGRLDGAFVVAIDDEPMQLHAMTLLFRRWGCDVLAAHSAIEAMAQLAATNRRPDAIVADYRLRGDKTGAEAIVALREAVRGPVPGVILTGDTEPGRMAEAAASGFELLYKPIDPVRLRDLLMRLLPGFAILLGS
ncbi:MAG: ATP-binding protein [Dongiaceae bacterium]